MITLRALESGQPLSSGRSYPTLGALRAPEALWTLDSFGTVKLKAETERPNPSRICLKAEFDEVSWSQRGKDRGHIDLQNLVLDEQNRPQIQHPVGVVVFGESVL